MRKRLIAFLAALLILCTFALPAMAVDSGRTLTIFFTHDMHDHILPATAEDGGEYGGFTRLATLLKQERARATYPTVTVDAGDFSMGSLFQTIYSSEAHELRLMGMMGFDATTLGNHEFDYRAAGLNEMLKTAVASGDRLPAIVQANYKPAASDGESKEAWNAYGISDYTIIERDGLRIAVFGVLGVDADECAPMSGMEFEPAAQAAERTVDYLEKNEDPDFVICLSHSGTNGGKGEDYELAEAVDGIDVIISGHTHSTLKEPIRVNDTLIVSCSEYTKNLGKLTVSKNGSAMNLLDYEIIPVNESVADDPELVKLAQELKVKVSEEYLDNYDYTFDQVLTVSDFDFTPFSKFGEKLEEDSLGNLIADSYIYAVQQAEGEDYVPVDLAVVGRGVIRESFRSGEITVAEAFDVSSLGSGADGTVGYPLVSVYIRGEELQDVFEVDATVSMLMPAVQMYGAGMNWSVNTNRMLFNRVSDSVQVLEDGTQVEIENDKLYRVVTGLYSAQMLGTVKEQSFGILSITPLDEEGNEITDFEARIIKNKNGSEVKEWYALASYLESMETVPQRYSDAEGRKEVYASWNPVELLKGANWITLLVLALILIVIVAIVLVIRAIARRKNRRYGNGYAGRSHGYRGRRRY